jgi:predicted nuclease with TOPRIM domain
LIEKLSPSARRNPSGIGFITIYFRDSYILLLLLILVSLTISLAAIMGDMDLNNLVRLKEALDGAQKNTKRMMNRLEKFENRLSDLDEKMRPIQVITARYTKAKENISQTITEIGKTYEYFRVANEVKETIHTGYSSHNSKEFLEAFLRLSSAKIFFTTHREIKSAHEVLSNIEHLLSVSFKCFVFLFVICLLLISN